MSTNHSYSRGLLVHPPFWFKNRIKVWQVDDNNSWHVEDDWKVWSSRISHTQPIYNLLTYIYIYIGSRRSHIQNCLGTSRIWIYHRFFILRSYSQNLGTDFHWTVGNSSNIINTAAATAATATNRFSEFSLGRKSGVVRCKGNSKSR